jgi:broad specificity phosphatase PhoE
MIVIVDICFKLILKMFNILKFLKARTATYYNYSGSNILLVAHGAVINAILAHISDGEIGSGKLINACVSNIEFIKEGWRVNHYNQQSGAIAAHNDLTLKFLSLSC